MAEHERSRGRLTQAELAAIDLTITALQARGRTIDDVETDDDPREQMAEALAELHFGGFEPSEHDREIIRQIKTLASQLSSHTTLRELVNLRGRLVQGRGGVVQGG